MKINYEFKDQKLLELALTQSGINSEKNNERLEFVGDRVLGLSVAQMIYEMYPNENEGTLARRHAKLVSTETLAKVAVQIELEHDLHHGHMTGGKIDHILANAMEAILGAVFIESGFETARNLIFELWSDLAKTDVMAMKDAKTALQEFVQKEDSGALPEYIYHEPTGVTHNPVFTVTVSAMGKSADGVGSSKKAASLDAADKLLKILAF